MILLGRPIPFIRRFVGQYVYWTGKDRGGPRDGWGILKRAAGRNLWVDERGFESILTLRQLDTLNVAEPRTASPTYLQLREGSLIGVVDSRDAVDSRFIDADRLSKAENHSDTWPGQHSGRWRWTFDNGLMAFVPESAPAPDQWEAVRQHVTKRYGIQWWDNGYHDLHHLLAHINAERAAREISPLPSTPASGTL